MALIPLYRFLVWPSHEGFCASCRELPGLVVCGQTQKEVMRKIKFFTQKLKELF